MPGKRYDVNGPGPSATNSFADPDLVTTREQDLDMRAPLKVNLPAHSLSVLRLAG